MYDRLHCQHLAIKSGESPVVICRPPPPGSDVARGHQAYYSLQEKVPIFRTDGPRRLASDNRLPNDTPIRLPDRNTDAIVITSSPPAPSAPHSPNNSSDVIASSPQPSAQVPTKRKAVVDSPSSQSDDDLYLADPKPKRVKSVAGKQKAPAKKESKGKGKVVVKEKQKERTARTRQSKKVVKSVTFIEDEDDSSSDNKPPATRPKPKPAYRGVKDRQESLPEESQKDTTSIPPAPAVPSRAASNSIPILPVRLTSGPPPDGQSKPSVEHAAQTPTPVAPAGVVSHPVHAMPGVPTRGTDPQPTEGQYLPHERHSPLHTYAADERNQYYHGRPPRAMDNLQYPPIHYQQSGLPRYPRDGDYYGYAPHSREYYGPQYPHVMHSAVQPPYAAPPPAPYHQHLHYDTHQQPGAITAPGGQMGNTMASSSRLSPPSHHAKSG